MLVIQLVPYGRHHSNPASRVEPKWDKPATRALARRACFDCHSNETVWPWYSHVAPVSWLVLHDVEDGRHSMNFSEWDKPQDDADHAAKMVNRGKMPLKKYLLLHPDARLSNAERDSLEMEWGRLQLEQSYWSSHAFVERVANAKLRMNLPQTHDVRIVRP